MGAGLVSLSRGNGPAHAAARERRASQGRGPREQLRTPGRKHDALERRDWRQRTRGPGGRTAPRVRRTRTPGVLLRALADAAGCGCARPGGLLAGLQRQKPESGVPPSAFAARAAGAGEGRAAQRAARALHTRPRSWTPGPSRHRARQRGGRPRSAGSGQLARGARGRGGRA